MRKQSNLATCGFHPPLFSLLPSQVSFPFPSSPQPQRPFPPLFPLPCGRETAFVENGMLAPAWAKPFLPPFPSSPPSFLSPSFASLSCVSAGFVESGGIEAGLFSPVPLLPPTPSLFPPPNWTTWSKIGIIPSINGFARGFPLFLSPFSPFPLFRRKKDAQSVRLIPPPFFLLRFLGFLFISPRPRRSRDRQEALLRQTCFFFFFFLELFFFLPFSSPVPPAFSHDRNAPTDITKIPELEQ